MRLIVNPHTIQLVQEQAVNEKEINISKCYFEFNEDITDNFVKEAYFTLDGNTYKQLIVNNECSYPQEVLVKEGTIELGVVAYLVENEQEIVRYNPTPVYFKTDLGSLKDAENSQPITPSEMEQYEQALQDGLSAVDERLTDAETVILEASNLNITGQKTNNVTYITITDKQGNENTFEVEDGQDGAKGDAFTYDDFTPEQLEALTGPQGEPGQDGADGRDGVIQYTAGNNISIENNVISALGGNPDVYFVAPTSSDPFIFDGKKKGLYIMTNYTSPFYYKLAESTNTLNISYYMVAVALYDDFNYDTSQYYYNNSGFIFYFQKGSGVYDKDYYLNRRQLDLTPNGIESTGSTLYGEFITTVQQRIKGEKTFEQLPKQWGNSGLVTPTNDTQLVHKKYVDDKIANSISDKIWIGTQAEYDELVVHYDSTLYFIKEDEDVSL